MSKRIAKKALGVKNNDLTWAQSLAEAMVDDPVRGEESVAGRIRRLYTNSYKALDQFDQLWYSIAYDKRDTRWETCYVWAIVLDCVINARAAWCELKSERVPMKDFTQKLIDCLKVYILEAKK